jgi:OOP family OmpA-OmpF porin
MSGRGATADSDTATPAPQPAAVRELPEVSPPPTAPPPQSGSVTVELTDDQAALFTTGSAVLSSAGETRLAEVVGQLASSGPLEVHGYTDGQGDTQTNLDLSRARAESVKSWLVANGVDAARIVTEGHGEVGAIDNADDPFRRKVALVYTGEQAA